LDETDTAAIITRRLVEENKKFNQGQVLAKYGTANLASTDSDSFITIIKLYDLVGYLLGHVLYNFDQLARLKLRYVRPSDEKLEEYYQAVSEFFDLFVEEIPSLKSYFTASKARSKRVLAQKRHDELNVLYRSVGLEIYIRAIQELVKKHKKSVAEAVRLVSRLPTSFSAKPYSEVLYDVAGERIIPGRVRITTSLALHMLGYSPANLDRVREKYAQILGTTADKVRLPRRVK
jgi:DNA sulfur modification protein DndB